MVKGDIFLLPRNHIKYVRFLCAVELSCIQKTLNKPKGATLLHWVTR